MPRALEREELLRERGQVLDKAERTAETPLGRALWETRLRSLDEKLAALGDQVRTKAGVALLFDGLPVRGTKEIRADFAAKVLETFQSLVGISFAEEAGQRLTARGRVPLVEQSRLYVREMARGSVGFVLEEPDDGQHEAFDSSLKTVVEKSVALIDAISAPDASAARIFELSPRLVQSAHKFAEVLVRGGADMRIYTEDRQVTLPQDRVAAMYNLLNEVKIDEDVRDIRGTILGLLPDSGQFEFRILENDEVLAGDTSTDIQWRYISEANFPERFVMRPVRAVIRDVKVVRAGRVLKQAFLLEDVQEDRGSILG